MSEKLANELLLSIGNSNASLQTAINLVQEFGVERVRGYLQEMAAGGERAKAVKVGLITSLLCCSDRLTAVLGEQGIQTPRRTIMRAVKKTPDLEPAFKRLIAGKATDDDLELVRGAIMQAGASDGAEPQGQDTPGPSQARSPAAVAEPRTQPPTPACLAVLPQAANEPGAAREINATPPAQGMTPRVDMKIYGAKAALTLEPTTSRTGNLALTVEAAVAKEPRKYDWANKIIIQLSQNEMYLLYAVLRGFLMQFEASGHGAANDKAFFIANQSNRFFIRVTQRGRPLMALPVEPPDAMALASMLVKIIVAHAPHLGDLAGVDALIQPMTAMMVAPERKAS